MSTTGAKHTVSAFDDDMNAIRGLISEMGSRGEAAVSAAMTALATHDETLAKQTVLSDKQLDELERQIETSVVRVIALRAPMADDLRELIAALRMAGVLERVGDYAKNIAKRAGQVKTSDYLKPGQSLARMGEIAGDMVRTVVEAHARRDVDLAIAVCRRDDELDRIYKDVFVDFVAEIAKRPEQATEIANLLFISKNLERIGDHATTCAEMVYYTMTGAQMPGDADS